MIDKRQTGFHYEKVKQNYKLSQSYANLKERVKLKIKAMKNISCYKYIQRIVAKNLMEKQAKSKK